jgi:signal transduction histidine kinase
MVDVLDISKIEANKLKLFLLEFNLNDLLLGSLVMVKENAKKHGIKLSTNINKIPETIKADERHLKQIIYNLLSNAVKFTPDGGAVILAARHLSFNNSHLVTQDGQEIVSPVTDNQEPITNGNFVLISVEDTGIGLKAGDLGRVFKPFEQVDSSLGRRYEGTGLGLALTKHLVELHGGRIWTESKGKDKGSKFSFIIPV